MNIDFLHQIAPNIVKIKNENTVFQHQEKLWCRENIGEDFWPIDVPVPTIDRGWSWYIISLYTVYCFTHVEDAIHFKMRWC